MAKYIPRRPRPLLAPWHVAPSADPAPSATVPTAERLNALLRAGAAQAANWAALGATYGGFAGAALAVLPALVYAVRRGLLADAATTVAVALLGTIVFLLAGGFLGALAGAAVGGTAGWLEVLCRRDESTGLPSHHEEGV